MSKKKKDNKTAAPVVSGAPPAATPAATPEAPAATPESQPDSDLDPDVDLDAKEEEATINLSWFDEKKHSGLRRLDVLRIRKSNTKNLLFESDLGKEFILSACGQVERALIQNTPDWFIVWEILK